MTSKIKEEFERLEWHDAVLMSLKIDRRAPGDRDEIELLVKWPSGQRQSLRFTDCYALDAQMNFGVVAPETINTAICVADSPGLTEVRRRWLKVGVDLGGLLCFELSANSTASVIRIFARHFRLFEAE